MPTILPVATQPGSPLAERAERIRTLIKRAGTHIVEAGRELIECKKIAGHGHWLPWLEREFGWKERTAQRFMQIAHAFGSNPSALTHLDLPLEGLYLLSAPGTPKEVRQEIVEHAKEGEKVTVVEIKNKIDAKKPRRPRKINGELVHDDRVHGDPTRGDHGRGEHGRGHGDPDHGDHAHDVAFGAARETQAQLAQDVGESSRSEVDRLRACNEEQANEIQQLKKRIIGLENEIADQRQPAPALTPLQLQAQIEKLGLPRFKREVLPQDWIPSLTNTAIALATPEKLIETLEKRLPPAGKAARKHLRALKKATTTGECMEILH